MDKKLDTPSTDVPKVFGHCECDFLNLKIEGKMAFCGNIYRQ
jgi:hypothetical protein